MNEKGCYAYAFFFGPASLSYRLDLTKKGCIETEPASLRFKKKGGKSSNSRILRNNRTFPQRPVKYV